MTSAFAPLLGAGAGALAALAVREAVLATPAVATWTRRALEPLSRAGREGYSPSAIERRRLGLLGAVAAMALGLALAGPRIGVLLAVAGPGIAGWAVARVAAATGARSSGHCPRSRPPWPTR